MTSLLLVIKKDWGTKSKPLDSSTFPNKSTKTSSPRIIQLQLSDFLKCSSRQTSKCSRSHITYNEILMKWNSIDNSIDIPNIQYLPFKSNWVLIKTISLRPRKNQKKTAKWKLQIENCHYNIPLYNDSPLLYSHSNTILATHFHTNTHQYQSGLGYIPRLPIDHWNPLSIQITAVLREKKTENFIPFEPPFSIFCCVSKSISVLLISITSFVTHKTLNPQFYL